jgi:hypothetical protein
MFEEIGVQLVNVRLLGFFENIFEYRGNPGHELVLMYEASVTDHTIYLRESFTVVESKEPEPITAVWKSLDDFDETPLYPDGLLAILRQRETQLNLSGGMR